MLERTDSPLNTIGREKAMFLLLNPFAETKFKTENPIIESFGGYTQMSIGEDGEPQRNVIDPIGLRNELAWNIEKIEVKTMVFDQSYTYNYVRQKDAWADYLRAKGYSSEIIRWVHLGRHEYYPLSKEKNDDITALAINIIGHEYDSLMRELKLWIIEQLHQQQTGKITGIFENWEYSSATPNDVWRNFKFRNWRGKITGRIKAWHDGLELNPDGLKIKQEVYLNFRDYAVIKYKNGTTEIVWANEHWTLPGYTSSLEEKIGQITIEGIRWFLSPDADEKIKIKIADWLIPNVFCIIGA
jgi:hypothetical protein